MLRRRKIIYKLAAILLPIIIIVLVICHITADRPGLSPDYIVFNTFSPSFKINGFPIEDISTSMILLKRERVIIDSCHFKNISKENNTCYTMFQFQINDTININDTIIFLIGDKTYKMYDIEEVQIKTKSYYGQAPLRRYKLNGKECSANWTIIDKDAGIYKNDAFR